MQTHGQAPLLSVKAVCARLGVSRSTLYQLQHRDGFPSGIKVGAQRRWRASDIDAWIEEQARSA